MTNADILAWHFVRDDWRLRDGRRVVVGEALEHADELKLCESGLHASEKLLDALKYASGSVLCRVTVGGEILRDKDKVVASRRTVLWAIDATEILRAFARWCALQVIHLWSAPQIVHEYLETGDESVRAAARAAAWDAAGAAQEKQLVEMIEAARKDQA